MQDRLQSTVMWQMQDVANAGKAIVYSDVANAGCSKCRMWQMQDRLQSVETHNAKRARLLYLPP